MMKSSPYEVGFFYFLKEKKYFCTFTFTLTLK